MRAPAFSCYDINERLWEIRFRQKSAKPLTVLYGRFFGKESSRTIVSISSFSFAPPPSLAWMIFLKSPYSARSLAFWSSTGRISETSAAYGTEKETWSWTQDRREERSLGRGRTKGVTPDSITNDCLAPEELTHFVFYKTTMGAEWAELPAPVIANTEC